MAWWKIQEQLVRTKMDNLGLSLLEKLERRVVEDWNEQKLEMEHIDEAESENGYWRQLKIIE